MPVWWVRNLDFMIQKRISTFNSCSLGNGFKNITNLCMSQLGTNQILGTARNIYIYFFIEITFSIIELLCKQRTVIFKYNKISLLTFIILSEKVGQVNLSYLTQCNVWNWLTLLPRCSNWHLKTVHRF